MIYKIKLWYTTGDSYSTHKTSEVLELTWSNLDIAKENLRRIKEHYICYNVDSSYGGVNSSYYKCLSPEDKLIYDTRTTKEWYTVDKDLKHFTYMISLKADNGNPWVIHTFWIGYFETLNKGMIISEDRDTYFEF